MPVWNLGSVNADQVYRLPRPLEPGETMTADSFQRGLGGKGANMSVALARAGSVVHHIGAVGGDGAWMRDRLAGYGVGVAHLAERGETSGHAIILLDSEGENRIVIWPAANHLIETGDLEAALGNAATGDWVLCQNETNLQADFARMARGLGLKVAYAAAPFDVEAAQAMLPHTDLLVLNEVEAAQLETATGLSPEALPAAHVVVTLGAQGCRCFDTVSGVSKDFPAPRVTVTDTTGAGDTFAGYLVGALDQGAGMEDALALAVKAGAVMVTRLGTADVIPTRDEVEEFFLGP
jgi:ribokinase